MIHLFHSSLKILLELLTKVMKSKVYAKIDDERYPHIIEQSRDLKQGMERRL